MNEILPLEVRGLKAGYPHRRVFDGLSLGIQRGKFTALIGPNGSGKSTLFRIILRGLAHWEGNILIEGRNIRSLSQVELASLVAFIPQYYIMPEGFTVAQIISMTDYARRSCTKEDVKKALEEVGIPYLENRFANSLSGGEAQLVMLCRAICCKAGLVLMDEPASNLDINRQAQLLTVAKSLARSGKTIFCAIHDLNSALKYADFCHVLDNGKLYASGPPEEVVNEKMLRNVFRSEARIFTEPQTGRRIIVS